MLIGVKVRRVNRIPEVRWEERKTVVNYQRRRIAWTYSRVTGGFENTERNGFVAFIEVVFGDENVEGLLGLTGRKPQCANRRCIVAALGSRAVQRKIINRRRSGYVANPGNSDLR